MSRPDEVVAEKGRKVQKKGQTFDILHFQFLAFVVALRANEGHEVGLGILKEMRA